MKQIAVIIGCILVLWSIGVNATDRVYYKLEKGAMIFVNVLDINKFVDLASGEKSLASEYFDDLLSRKLAIQTDQEVTVYKFDKFVSGGVISCYRIKVPNGATVRFIDTNAGITRTVNYKNDTILGWVYGDSLKEIKRK